MRCHVVHVSASAESSDDEVAGTYHGPPGPDFTTFARNLACCRLPKHGGNIISHTSAATCVPEPTLYEFLENYDSRGPAAKRSGPASGPKPAMVRCCRVLCSVVTMHLRPACKQKFI